MSTFNTKKKLRKKLWRLRRTQATSEPSNKIPKLTLIPVTVQDRQASDIDHVSNSAQERISTDDIKLKEERTRLPICKVKDELIGHLKKNPTVILIGETACGKTTQVPQFLLEANVGCKNIIAVTQPRRVAAITISERVAKEMKTEVGDLVGYCVRFDDMTSDKTKIKFCTDGMLLRESILDPLLMRYSTIILDEAHERTVSTDVLFGIIKLAQSRRFTLKRRFLKIIVMSATMDVDHFSKYFKNAPVFYIEGRQNPIQIQYTKEKLDDYMFASLVTVFQIHRNEPPGDILVFCTGQEEIESAVQATKETNLLLPHGSLPLIALPLYSALPSNIQLKVFQPTAQDTRKVIFSTNIAETSVTIPGIKYVIDSGMVKCRTFNPGNAVDLLKVRRISKAQAWQRAGRAGRESSGVCYRLYTEQEFKKFLDHTIPEIQRSNLGNVILQLIALGIKDLVNFDFMDKPKLENINMALFQLQLLGAVQKIDYYELTELGQSMSAFPMEPRFSKILIASTQHGCTEEILTILALLNVDAIFHTPPTKREEVAEARKKFESNDGDHIMLLKTFRAYKKAKCNKGWCKENYLHLRNLASATKVRKQLSDLCTSAGIAPKSCGANFSVVRRCLATGLFTNVAELQQEGHYISVSTSRQEVHIHPSSCLFQSKPAYLLYTELVQTNRCYMRNVSLVDPDWLLEIAPTYFRRGKHLTVAPTQDFPL